MDAVKVVPLFVCESEHVPQDRQVVAHGPGAHLADAPFFVGGDLLRRELTDGQPGSEGREHLFLQNPFVLVERALAMIAFKFEIPRRDMAERHVRRPVRLPAPNLFLPCAQGLQRVLF